MATIAMTFDLSTSSKKIERTHNFTGVVIYAEDYTTKNNLPGISMQVEGCPYNLRLLKNSIKGAGNAATVLGCTVEFTGVIKEHEGKSYFNPKDAVVTRRSGIATIAAAKVAYAGSLD